MLQPVGFRQLASAPVPSGPDRLMTLRGFDAGDEDTTNSSETTHSDPYRGAESGAVGQRAQFEAFVASLTAGERALLAVVLAGFLAPAPR